MSRYLSASVSLGFVMVALLHGVAHAAADKAPTTQQLSADDLATPRNAILAFDRLVTANGEDAAAQFFHPRNDDEHKVVAAYAKVEGEIVKLQKGIAAKFGEKVAIQFLHTIGDVSREEIIAAKVDERGDRAVLTYPTDHEPAMLVKIDGKWFVDVSQDIKESGGAQNIVDLEAKMQGKLHAIAERLDGGEYKNAEEVIAAAKLVDQ